jgi:hypothetical protein
LDKLKQATGKGTPDAVLEVIDEHGSDFGEAHVEEALQQLSTLAKGWSTEDKKGLHGARGLQTLIGNCPNINNIELRSLNIRKLDNYNL